MKTATEPKCSMCDRPCEDGPMRGEGVDAICYDCWREECTFDCCKCANIEDDEHQDEIGCLVVVVENGAGVSPGLYKIIRHPYYGGPIIGGMSLFPEALKRLGPVPKRCDTNGYPAGHLCRECPQEPDHAPHRR